MGDQIDALAYAMACALRDLAPPTTQTKEDIMSTPSETKIRSRTSIALGEYAAWPHMITLSKGDTPTWSVHVRLPDGTDLCGQGETIEGAAGAAKAAVSQKWTARPTKPATEATPTPQPTPTDHTARQMVTAILADVTDRYGWRQEWEGFTTSTKAEIEADLTRIVREFLRPFDELAKGAAAALLLHPEGEAGYIRAIGRCIESAAEARCAKGVLDGLLPYASGMRSAHVDDALPYEGAEREDERAGRLLLAAANGAVARAIRMEVEVHRLTESRRVEREDAHRTRNQLRAANMGLTLHHSDAHDVLDGLGVPRLPAPFDRSIRMRIEILAAMNQGQPTGSTAPEVVG